jgi:hypothetical protein
MSDRKEFPCPEERRPEKSGKKIRKPDGRPPLLFFAAPNPPILSDSRRDVSLPFFTIPLRGIQHI